MTSYLVLEFQCLTIANTRDIGRLKVQMGALVLWFRWSTRGRRMRSCAEHSIGNHLLDRDIERTEAPLRDGDRILTFSLISWAYPDSRMLTVSDNPKNPSPFARSWIA